jgi:hypothetical protein
MGLLNFYHKVMQSSVQQVAAEKSDLQLLKKVKGNEKDTTTKVVDKDKSIQLLDKQIDVKDLLEQVQAKAAQTTMQSFKKKIKGKVEQEAKSLTEELIGKEASIKDVVKLSFGKSGDVGEKIKKQKKEKEEKLAEKRTEKDEEKGSRMEQKTRTTRAYTQDEKRVKTQQKKQDSEMTQASADQKGETSNTRSLMQKYCSAWAEKFVENNPKKKAELKELKAKLAKAGISEEKMGKLDHKLQQSLVKDLKTQVRDGFVKYALAYTPASKKTGLVHEYLTHYKSLKESLVLVDEMGLFTAGSQDVLR